MSTLTAWLLRRLWWIRKWVVLLRERQVRVHAAAELVAGELEANANIMGKPFRRMDMSSRPQLHFDAWMQQRANLYPIAKKDAALWSEVQATYAALHRPLDEWPEPDVLTGLASRLRTTEF